ncbi:trypsin-like peptidase domain-containing protein [Streptomyces roseirectus]|uniref:Trypsin-like peptidase domain-containing protein n=1 Tax=Streptomyces roseirectus TaxID=2768066 RepID=A0A7H0IAN4_9ACTN|nr:trypsin-like peptidase domain-containing protein [Streptomyces roseirectus]QNP69850.1 trypsin-like peptidase domain-containing protein [Streptomyces roseirectus]
MGGRAAQDGTDDVVVRIRDLAGRPRGTGFLADHHGTLITAHEVVDGLPRIVLHGAGDRTCVVTSAAVTPLPELDLALVHTEGLDMAPLPVSVRERAATGTYVRVAAGGWREARVLAAAQATYTATDRFHLLDDTLELAIGTAGRDALRLGGGAAGGPVLDAATGTVVAVLGTALQTGHRDVGFAVQLRPGARRSGALAEVLARNAATVPAYGADLNLAGVLEVTATSVGSDGPVGALVGWVGGWPGGGEAEGSAVLPVERGGVVREFAAFARGDASVLALVGAPGSGRTTELAALAARRHRSSEPAPTLWLRGADLRDDDESLADAVGRALRRAARIVTTSDAPTAPPDAETITPAIVSRLSLSYGRPLYLLLDAPEEMPPFLSHRLPSWTRATATWLRETGARLVLACRPEFWEHAGAEFPGEMLYGGGRGRGSGGRGATASDDNSPAPSAVHQLTPLALCSSERPAVEDEVRSSRPELPACVEVGEFTEEEARVARVRYRVPEGALGGRAGLHPLSLRLLGEVREAMPRTPAPVDADRDDVFGAYLDLMCLRIAVRLAVENGLRGTAVRRLAARVSGQVHEAARRSLGPGQGELDRAAFEDVFPWGQAPARLGGGTGWASAVLAEGLLVPAGTGYRFAHEELADWIQGTHLDLEEALNALAHRPRSPHLVPVPHHRIGPVVEALLLSARHQGPPRLARHLGKLTSALAETPDAWWPAHLLTETLLRVPDATAYLEVLHAVADHVVARTAAGKPATAFPPAFWTALPLPAAPLFTLLRHLLRADPPPDTRAPRYLDAVAELLAADPTTVQPHLTLWFEDDRPLPGAPEATVAEAAQALLYAHRHRALDDLTDVLVGCGHRRADELLGALAEDEPSALCRAVDRWARDTRPARRVAAVSYGLKAAPHVRTDADRDLLRYAAEELRTELPLEGGALALLVQDPRIRATHLPQALAHFTAADPGLPATALLPALTTHPEPVLKAFRTRLNRPDTDPATTLRALAGVTTHPLTRRIAIMVRETVERRPETAEAVAGYVDARLAQGTPARAVLHPLVTSLLTTAPHQVRSALAAVLATPDDSALRAELREFLLAHEDDPAVLTTFLHAAARHRSRDLVHRTGRLLVRTPDGATRFDRGLVDLGRHVPGFAARVAGWLTEAPDEWATVVGPAARRMIENLAGAGAPA